VPVTTEEIIEAYGEDLRGLLNEVSAAITTAELSELNKRYGLDAEDPEDLAREWLVSKGFIEE
jgi:glycine betaine/choline ABC-type transport system substrate-binding protein